MDSAKKYVSKYIIFSAGFTGLEFLLFGYKELHHPKDTFATIPDLKIIESHNDKRIQQLKLPNNFVLGIIPLRESFNKPTTL